MSKQHNDNDETKQNNDDIIEPISASFDEIVNASLNAKKKQVRPTLKTPKNSGSKTNNSVLVPTPIQPILPHFHVEKQVEHDGVEMGVLENGIPYLTESGLARMCGIDRKVLNRLAIGWDDEKTKPRGQKINQLLLKSGYTENTLYLKSEHKSQEINAYTEPVCLALLEYYAFEADEKREQAQNAFRLLARTKFREFIYNAVGYYPEQRVLDSWKHFHDRVDLTMNAVPFGYFCIFTEIASMLVPMIRSGILISDKVIPDISVGIVWANNWRKNNFDALYGQRIEYAHNYPFYYPQSKSNPQPAWAYPNKALGLFREWLEEHYIRNKFPSYLLDQARQGKLSSDIAQKTIDVFTSKQIEAE